MKRERGNSEAWKRYQVMNHNKGGKGGRKISNRTIVFIVIGVLLFTLLICKSGGCG